MKLTVEIKTEVKEEEGSPYWEDGKMSVSRTSETNELSLEFDVPLRNTGKFKVLRHELIKIADFFR